MIGRALLENLAVSSRRRLFRPTGSRGTSLLFAWILWATLASLGFSQPNEPANSDNILSPYFLVGVVVSCDAVSAVAVFKNAETGNLVNLSTGESLLGMELVQVAKDGILLKREGRIYWNLLTEGPQAGGAEKTPPELLSEADVDQLPRLNVDSEGVVRLPEKEYRRSDIEKRFERERVALLRETSVAPNYIDGKMAGFRVLRWPKKGVASEAGIHEGDIIKEVNGVELNSLAAVVRFARRFHSEDRFEVLIERDDRLVRQVYVLK